MRLLTKTFKNELGRDITLDIDRPQPSPGDHTAITIRLTGPDTVSENTVTLAEARELRAALNATVR